ncbi:hypothetical protein LC607_19740 [Nostoc sp. CHAB 5824]|nr:hypothetical protein [Nostoc sp. CHAB 5824]
MLTKADAPEGGSLRQAASLVPCGTLTRSLLLRRNMHLRKKTEVSSSRIRVNKLMELYCDSFHDACPQKLCPET